MSISSETSNDGQNVTIAIAGQFDFNVVQEFRNAYMNIGDGAADVTLDMRETEYMDSSALGMLLNMKKHLGVADHCIRIVNCRPQVKKILDISRFDKKFQID
ncbi:MAG: STAS domain-containing protein [Pseudomonadales bacterium]|nr:STAS domain-containing protein [Pseudomonadales bacterium]